MDPVSSIEFIIPRKNKFSPSFICPIIQDVMANPGIDQHGHSKVLANLPLIPQDIVNLIKIKLGDNECDREAWARTNKAFYWTFDRVV